MTRIPRATVLGLALSAALAPAPARQVTGDEVFATPAFAGGRFYVRTRSAHDCFGK